MPSVVWGKDVAVAYDATSAAMYDPAVLGPTADVLAALADGGPALELAIGTGRVALALRERGVDVSGIELSPHMVEQLRAKPGADAVHVAIGDMTTTRVPGDFALVYLVFNTIMNVTTQDEQVAVFVNAAAHLRRGGRFVVEVGVPELRGVSVDHPRRVFDDRPEHVGIDTFDDPVGQITWSHHWWELDGRLHRHAAPYRYVWPGELDLMARVAGLTRLAWWDGWTEQPLTSASTNLVAVYERPEA